MDIFVILLLFSIGVVLTLFFLLEQKTRHSFESKIVYYVGNGTTRFILDTLKGIGFIQSFSLMYSRLKSVNVKVAGGMTFGKRTLIIMDPKLITSMLVKDFDNFVDRTIIDFPTQDYLFTKMLITLKGERWKALRSKLSPTFTTGKMKRLFALFDVSAKKLVQFLESQVACSTNSEMDLTIGFSKFAIDIIASAVCGLNSNAFDQIQPSLFEKMGAKLQPSFGGWQGLKILIMFTSPKLMDLLGLSIFDMDMQDFFRSGITSSIKERMTVGVKRNDFLQLMLEARADNKLDTEEGEQDGFEKDAKLDANSVPADTLDDLGITANCVLFILAGFDTTQSLLLFLTYALALNRDVQDKVRTEIETERGENGELTYDAVQKMSYLDMVIQETLRYYPPSGVTDRSVTTDYKVPGTEYTLRKGDGIQIPINGLHHDPEYFPNPEKFDPERFSAKNKGNINAYAFLPFGSGPRNCIGMKGHGRRFALTEVKVGVVHLLQNFRIEPSSKTLIPMKYQKTTALKPEGGMFLSLNRIQR